MVILQKKLCLFVIKWNFWTLVGIIEMKPKFIGTQIGFIIDPCIRDHLGFYSNVKYERNNSSDHPVDISSFEDIFLDCDIAHGMILKGKLSGKNRNFTKYVDLGYI